MDRSFAIKVKHDAINKHSYIIRHFHLLFFVILMTNIKMAFKMVVNQDNMQVTAKIIITSHYNKFFRFDPHLEQSLDTVESNTEGPSEAQFYK